MKIKVSFLVLVIFNFSWNAFLYTLPNHQTTYNYLFNLVYGAIFLFGSLVALYSFKKTTSPTLNKSYLFYGLSLLTYSIAMSIWAYYNLVANVEAPYPGITDIFFILYSPLSIIAIIYLVKNFGGKINLVAITEIIVLTAIIFLITSSFIYQTGLDFDQPLLINLLNLLYPLLDAALVSTSIICLRSARSTLNINLLTLSLASILMATADTVFLYRISIESYWNGDISDTLFMISGALFVLGIIQVKNSSSSQILTPSTASS